MLHQDRPTSKGRCEFRKSEESVEEKHEKHNTSTCEDTTTRKKLEFAFV